MSQPPRHTNTDGVYDVPATSGFGDGPLTLGPEWGELAGVVLFDPETDASPYAAKRPARKSRVPGEKPSAKGARVTQPAPKQAPQTLQLADNPEEPEKPSARRGGLRVVSNDPAEIRQLAEAQYRSDSVRESRAPKPAPAPEPAQTKSYVDAGSTNAFSSVPAWSTFQIEDDGKPSARRKGSMGASQTVGSQSPTTGAALPFSRRNTASPSHEEDATTQADSSKSPLPRPQTVSRKRNPEIFWRGALVSLFTTATLLACLVMLYFPSQELYLAIRENERLTDELAQNVTRNSQMQERVASLQTAEGIQDEARRSYNLVMPGDHAVQVVGVPTSTPASSIPAEVPRGSGENTHTWATDLLDRVFGVAGPTVTTAAVDEVATVTESVADPTADIVAQGDEA